VPSTPVGTPWNITHPSPYQITLARRRLLYVVDNTMFRWAAENGRYDILPTTSATTAVEKAVEVRPRLLLPCPYNTATAFPSRDDMPPHLPVCVHLPVLRSQCLWGPGRSAAGTSTGGLSRNSISSVGPCTVRGRQGHSCPSPARQPAGTLLVALPRAGSCSPAGGGC
jgi:hypothetical protein